MDQLDKVRAALGTTSQIATAAIEATSNATQASRTLSAEIEQTLAPPPAKPATSERGPNVAWAYYGLHDEGKWTTRYLKKEPRDDDELPAPGDRLVAQSSVTIRKDVIRSVPGKGFVNAEALGSLKRGDRIQVLEVRGPNDEDVGSWATIWITFLRPEKK